MPEDIVQRLRSRAQQAAQKFGRSDDAMRDGANPNAVDLLWFAAMDAVDEIKRLRNWQESAAQLLDQVYAIADTIPDQLLGSSKIANIGAELDRLRAENKRLREVVVAQAREEAVQWRNWDAVRAIDDDSETVVMRHLEAKWQTDLAAWIADADARARATLADPSAVAGWSPDNAMSIDTARIILGLEDDQ